MSDFTWESYIDVWDTLHVLSPVALSRWQAKCIKAVIADLGVLCVSNPMQA
jgi:hypothetical protein